MVRDGSVYARASHTRKITFEGVAYRASVAEPSTSVIAVGLEADTSELTGEFDSVLTYANRAKWAGAEIVKQILFDYRNVSLGSYRKQVGSVGKLEPIGQHFFRIEFRSQVDKLKQKVGEITSNTDRNTTIEETGVTVAPFIHSTSVASFTDQRTFKTLHVAADDDYFTNGRIEWLTGANAGLFMEIKTGIRSDGNTRTLITLQEKMMGVIANGDTLKLYKGYVGTREAAKELGDEAVLNSRVEWDMPPETKLISYPE